MLKAGVIFVVHGDLTLTIIRNPCVVREGSSSISGLCCDRVSIITILAVIQSQMGSGWVSDEWQGSHHSCGNTET